MTRLILLFVALACSARGGLTSVPASQIPLFALDADADGLPELSAFQTIQGTGELLFEIRVDALDTPFQFPDRVFVGVASEYFSTLDDLGASPLRSGDFRMPPVLSRDFNNETGFGALQPNAPIAAFWVFGTSGSGSDNVRLVGLILDATEYFRSGKTAPLKIYHRDYGSFGAGAELPGASLAETGVPLPRVGLEAASEPLGPKSGRIRVASKPGKIYRLMRGNTPAAGQAITTLSGTGQELVLPWDDSASADTRAFFWVEESAQ